MMPRPVLRTLLVLVALAALAGLWLGWPRGTLTESVAIERAAARYVEETGGAATDCVATTGDEPRVWIVVNCGTAASISRYRMDHDGRFLDARGPET